MMSVVTVVNILMLLYVHQSDLFDSLTVPLLVHKDSSSNSSSEEENNTPNDDVGGGD